MKAETDLDRSLREGWDDALSTFTERLKTLRENRVRSLFKIDETPRDDALAVADPSMSGQQRRDGSPVPRPSRPVSELSVAHPLPDGAVRDLTSRVARLTWLAVTAEDRYLGRSLTWPSRELDITLSKLRNEPAESLGDKLNGAPHGLLLPSHLWAHDAGSSEIVEPDRRKAVEQALKDELGGPIIQRVQRLSHPLLVPLESCTIHEAHDFQLHRAERRLIALTAAFALTIPRPGSVYRLK